MGFLTAIFSRSPRPEALQIEFCPTPVAQRMLAEPVAYASEAVFQVVSARAGLVLGVRLGDELLTPKQAQALKLSPEQAVARALQNSLPGLTVVAAEGLLSVQGPAAVGVVLELEPAWLRQGLPTPGPLVAIVSGGGESVIACRAADDVAVSQVVTLALASALNDQDVIGPMLVEPGPPSRVEPLLRFPESALAQVQHLEARKRLVAAHRYLSLATSDEGEAPPRMLHLATPPGGGLVATWARGSAGVLPRVDAVAFIDDDGTVEEIDFATVQEALLGTPALSPWSPAAEALFQVERSWFPTPRLRRYMARRAATRLAGWRDGDAAAMVKGLASGEVVVARVESRARVELCAADGRRAFASAADVRAGLEAAPPEDLLVFSRLVGLAEFARALATGEKPDFRGLAGDLNASVGEALPVDQLTVLPIVQFRADLEAGWLSRPFSGPFDLVLYEVGDELKPLLAGPAATTEELWRVGLKNLRAASRAPKLVLEFDGCCSPCWEDSFDAARLLVPDVLEAIRPLSRHVVVTLGVTPIYLVDREDPAAILSALQTMEARLPEIDASLLLTGQPWMFDALETPQPWVVPAGQPYSERFAAFIAKVEAARGAAAKA